MDKVNIEEILGMRENEFLNAILTGTYCVFVCACVRVCVCVCVCVCVVCVCVCVCDGVNLISITNTHTISNSERIYWHLSVIVQG